MWPIKFCCRESAEGNDVVKATHAIVCAPLTRWLSNTGGETRKCALLMQPTSTMGCCEGFLMGQGLATNEDRSSVVDAKLCKEGVWISAPHECGPRSPRQESCVTTERGNNMFFLQREYIFRKKNVYDGLQLLVGWATVSGNACTVHAYFYMRTCANLCTLAA